MDEDGYCDICHRSDPRGVKHIYTKNHKERVNNVLRKFERKVQIAKEYFTLGPSIDQRETSHLEDKFWCPFCVAEVLKHESEGQFSIMFKSWVLHLCSQDHNKKVHNFFWRNKLDMKRRDKYKLSPEKANLVQEMATRSLDRYRELSLKVIKLEASRIREVERQRAVLQDPSSSPFSADAEQIPPTHSTLVHPNMAGRNTDLKTWRRDTDGLDGAEVDPGGSSSVIGNHPIVTDQKWQLSWNHQTEALQKPHPVDIATANSLIKLCNRTLPDNKAEVLVHQSYEKSACLSTQPSILLTQQRSSPHEGPTPSRSSTHTDLGHLVQSKHQIAVGPTQRSSNQAHVSFSQVTHKRGMSGHSGSSMDPLMQRSGQRRGTKVVSSGGLTVIHRKKSLLHGNIHTGALPPWMLEDADEEGPESEEAVSIGPTEEDFKKHLEKERKRKLNPKRVGANFDHDAETAEEWLPSFGRVWNHGPRWQSRKQYRKEAENKPKKSR